MNLKSITIIILIVVCILTCTAVVTKAESFSGKGIQGISENNLIIQIEEKISLSELEKELPSTLQVTLVDGSVENVDVTWKCEVDYEHVESDTYVFEAEFPSVYTLVDTCPSAFAIVMLNKSSLPQTYIAWESNPESTKRFDAYLGVTGNVVEWLESHENDDYYLGTPYYGDLDYPKKCTRANGEYEKMGYETAGMNCTGFVASVMRKLGGDLGKIVEYSERGKYANAYNWHYTAHNKSIKSYRYKSITNMLASGKLEKGDIIYFEPDWTIEGVDCHMGFFWGDTSDDNKFWHSVKGEGNIISKIKSKSSYEYVYIFKNTPPGKMKLTKKSSDEAISNNNLYSLKNAIFGVYTTYNETTGKLNGKVGELITNADGSSNILSLKEGTYYIKEVQAPKGFLLNENVKKVELISGKTTTVSFSDTPQVNTVGIFLEKIDKETEVDIPSENVNFENAEFHITYYKGYHDSEDELKTLTPDRTWVMKTDAKGQCKMTEEYKVSGDPFIFDKSGNIVLPLGTVAVKETKAPKGYLINEQTFIIQIKPDTNTNSIKTFATIVVPETKIPETPVIPETGDTLNYKNWLISLFVASAIVIYMLRKKKIVLK